MRDIPLLPTPKKVDDAEQISVTKEDCIKLYESLEGSDKKPYENLSHHEKTFLTIMCWYRKVIKENENAENKG